MMFPLKTLKTKRKSYEITWEWNVFICALFSLFVILTFSLRAVLMASTFGGVLLEIPTVNIPLKDDRIHNFSEQSLNYIRESTPTVILTSTGFFFGSLSAFSVDFKENKRYAISHQDGHPMLGNLIFQMEKWLLHRSKTENIPNEKVLILIPSSEIPVPIVTQVAHELKSSSLIDRVILGGGVL